MATQDPSQPNHAESLVWLLSSLSDNGKSLRSFLSNPQELGVCILTAGLLANSKLSIAPDDAIKVALETYAKVQVHVGQYHQAKFTANLEEVFQSEKPTRYEDRPPELEHD
jgi:hypothetical protein